MKTSKKVLSILSCSLFSVCTITPIILTGCSTNTTQTLKLDITAFKSVNLTEKGEDVYCDLKATYGDQDVKLDQVTFTYSKENVLTAKWNKTSQQVQLTPVTAGTTTLNIKAVDINNHSASASVSLTVNEAPIVESLKLDTTKFEGIKLYARKS